MDRGFVEEFNQDKKLFKWMKRNLHKRHPKWKARKWVRVTLYIVSLIFLIVFWRVLPLILTLIYSYFLRNSCRGPLGYYVKNTVVLTEDSLSYLYNKNTDEPETRREMKFPYSDIMNIGWNEYRQRYEIIGLNIDIMYSNYQEGEIEKQREKKGNLEEPYHLYWVFEDRDKFAASIESKTGLKIEELKEVVFTGKDYKGERMDCDEQCDERERTDCDECKHYIKCKNRYSDVLVRECWVCRYRDVENNKCDIRYREV